MQKQEEKEKELKTIKEQLKSLYANNLKQMIEVKEKVREKYADKELDGPFLISPNKNYIHSKKKLFIIGQQTYGWECYEDIDAQMKEYEEFNLAEKSPKHRNSPFWDMFHKIERLLLNCEYCAAWGNMNRYDFDGDKPSGEIEKEISKLDYLLREEIKILNPDICIFFTSHYFDERIKNIFPGAVFKDIPGWDLKELCKIEHPELPRLCFRTYHPNYLRRAQLEDKFLTTLKQEIE